MTSRRGLRGYFGRILSRRSFTAVATALETGSPASLANSCAHRSAFWSSIISAMSFPGRFLLTPTILLLGAPPRQEGSCRGGAPPPARTREGNRPALLLLGLLALLRHELERHRVHAVAQ